MFNELGNSNRRARGVELTDEDWAINRTLHHEYQDYSYAISDRNDAATMSGLRFMTTHGCRAIALRMASGA